MKLLFEGHVPGDEKTSVKIVCHDESLGNYLRIEKGGSFITVPMDYMNILLDESVARVVRQKLTEMAFEDKK